MDVSAKYLLVSDLDDTLLGDPGALARFSEFLPAAPARIDIVYATGRFFESVRRDVETTPLPEPVAVIGGVGSEIRSFPAGDLDRKWIERLSGNWSAATVRDVLARAGEADLELQPEECQSRFKVSYFLPAASAEQLDRLRAKLVEAGVEASLTYSSDRDLDFLPRGADKGSAAVFVAGELGVDRDHVIVAGNSANDIPLFKHGFLGVIVSNAHDELKECARDPRIYLSPEPRADGVRDGIEHWLRSTPPQTADGDRRR